jgi:RimJ/RimL family protein N-acetyltransferase
MESSTQLLPDRLTGDDGLLVRRWRIADAETLARAVAESADHLRPWMAWMAEEPMSIDRRRSMLADREREWLRGGDVILGVFVDGCVAGSCGLHRRIAHDGLELGYWIHPRFTRRGLATAVARRLTDAALSSQSITHVEIHHDKANVASAGIPRKLGFRLFDEIGDRPAAPAEIGIECRWRMQWEEWIDIQPRSEPPPH